MIFEIFKAGKHKNSNGVEREFTSDDLDTIVKNYNPDEREAPLVLGHPKDNDPAFGWVDKIFRKGETLFAESKDEAPEFIQAVKERRFPKRSISLTPDLKLNHIGFLGAFLPAVNGLAPVKFNSDEELLTYNLDQELKEYENENDIAPNVPQPSNSSGGDKYIKTNTEPNLDLQLKNKTPEINNSPLESFSDTLNEISDSLTKLKTFTESFSQNFANSDLTELKDSQRKKITDQLDNLRMKIDVNNFEVLLNEKMLYGSLTPVMKNKITKTLRFLNNQNFENFDSQKFILELKSQLMDFINSIPKFMSFETLAEKPDDDNIKDLVDDNYDGLQVDSASEQTHKKVLQKMKEKEIDYPSALKLIIN